MNCDVFVEPEMRDGLGSISGAEFLPFDPIVISRNHSVVLLEERYDALHLGVV